MTKGNDGFEPVTIGGKFVKWETEGQQLCGKLLALEMSKKYDSGAIARMATEEDERVAFSCPMLLEQAIRDNELLGRVVRITYVGKDEDVKLFTVDVKRA